MEALGPTPDTTADYNRLAALPILQGPAVLMRLRDWMNVASVQMAWLVWNRAAESEINPEFASFAIPRTLEIDEDNYLIVPADIPAQMLGDALVSTSLWRPILPWDKEWQAIAVDRFGLRANESIEAFTARMEAALVWDENARLASPLPIPHHPDESLIILSGRSGSTRDMIPETLPGALAASPAQTPYLLRTPHDEGGGELTPELLRSPVTGLVRFERYHHIVTTPDRKLSLRRPSRDGRLVLRATPLTLLDPEALGEQFDDVAEINRPLVAVFENIEADSVLDPLAALIADQVWRYRELSISKPFANDPGGLGRALRETVAWSLRVWQAASNLNELLTYVPSKIASSLRQLVPLGQMPSDEFLDAAVAIVVADSDSWRMFRDFLTEIFAPLMRGDDWRELGVSPNPSAAEGTAEKEALDFVITCDRWIPCFAGAPLGQPGRAWLAGELATVAWDAESARFTQHAALIHRIAYSTFHVEALYQARFGGEGDPVTDHGAARAAGLISESELIAYATPLLLTPVGGRAVLRLVERELPKHPFTTIDWFEEMTRGNGRRRLQLPLLDFEAYADAGHPLAALVDWDRYRAARTVRDGMDQLRLLNLHTATTSWWAANTRLANAAGLWPSYWSTSRVRPGPRTMFELAGRSQSGRDRIVTSKSNWQYRLSSKGGLPEHNSTTQGSWDDFDLLAVQKAARAVREARALVSETNPGFVSIHPALVMAVAETEGFRLFNAQQRIRDIVGDGAKRNAGAAFLWSPKPSSVSSFMSAHPDDYAVANYWLHPFELDMMVYLRNGDALDIASQNKWVINRLSRVDWEGVHGTDPETPFDAMRSLLDPDLLHPEDVYDLVHTRVRGEWVQIEGYDVHRSFRLSRRLDWIGLSIQSAIFQWVHLQLHRMIGYDSKTYRRVEELVDPAMPPPMPGVDVLDPARRDYIAYWAAVYMAFNTSPEIWNDWIDFCQEEKAPGERVTNYLLYRLNNSSSTPSNAAKYAVISNMTRFAVALDAYLRLDFTVDLDGEQPTAAAIDTTDPSLRNWS